MIDDALALVSLGFSVFPLAAGTKTGQIVSSWPAESSCESDVVRKWWNNGARHNIGVDCGKSGLVVVDVDVRGKKNGMQSLDMLELEHGALPPTAKARTASGGIHLYFYGCTKNSVEKLGSGLDVRSRGGYVVAPSSVTVAGEYEWIAHPSTVGVAQAPDWLIELCGKPAERAPRVEAPKNGWDNPADVEWCKGYLEVDAPTAVEGEGGDLTTFRVAAVLRDKGLCADTVVELMLTLWNDRCCPPWDERELRLKVANVFSYASSDAGKTSVGEFEPVEEKEDEKYSGIFDDWVWVAELKRFVRRSDSYRADKEQFDSLYNFMVDGGRLSDKVFKNKHSIRKFFKLCYRPTRDEFCGEAYNVFRPSKLAHEAGDASWFEQHIEYLVPDEEARGHVLDWMAFVVQRPGEKLHYSLLLQGNQGTGKSFIGHVLGQIVGEHNVGRPSNAEIAEPYTGWMVAKQLIVIEELMAMGRREIANRLKPLITDPLVRVREMFTPQYTIENYMNFLLFTNYRDAIPIEKGDRRYLVVFSPAKARDTAYYNKLWGHIKAGGAAHVASWLASRDLTDFHPHAHAPMTQDKMDMQRETLSELDQYLIEAHENGTAPFDHDLVKLQDVMDALPRRIADRHNRLGNCVGTCLREHIGAVKLGQQRLADGKKAYLWAVRNHEKWEAASLRTRAEHYERQFVDDDFLGA